MIELDRESGERLLATRTGTIFRRTAILPALCCESAARMVRDRKTRNKHRIDQQVEEPTFIYPDGSRARITYYERTQPPRARLY